MKMIGGQSACTKLYSNASINNVPFQSFTTIGVKLMHGKVITKLYALESMFPGNQQQVILGKRVCRPGIFHAGPPSVCKAADSQNHGLP